jgi:thiol-disulfide isomerase/thioredoxin
MIYMDGCLYCDMTEPIIDDFGKKNSSKINIKKVNMNDIKEYGFSNIHSAPTFILEHQDKRIKFDFYDELHNKRTYNKLVSNLNQIVNLSTNK